jgi:hypothetical protein
MEDRYSYANYPGSVMVVTLMGSAVLLIPFAILAFAKIGLLPPALYLITLAALMIWSHRGSMQQKSDIVLTQEGFSRYEPKGKWLSVAWQNIESVALRRVSTGPGIGATRYLLHLKANPQVPGRKATTVKVFSDMVRRDVFDQVFVNHLRENGIPMTAN